MKFDSLPPNTVNDVEQDIERKELVDKVKEFYQNYLTEAEKDSKKSHILKLRAAVMQFYMFPEIFEVDELTQKEIGDKFTSSTALVQQQQFEISSKLAIFLEKQGIIAPQKSFEDRMKQFAKLFKQ